MTDNVKYVGKPKPNWKKVHEDSRLTFLFITTYYRVGKSSNYMIKALYECSCGNFKEANVRDVRFGITKSCGCLQSETAGKLLMTHGKYTHPLNAIYHGMKDRCNNPNSKIYPYYGGRGITVCKEWEDDFEVFYNWAMANGYRKGLQLDRIDNDGPYSPDNCRYVTRKKNVRNSRIAKLTVENVREIKKMLSVGAMTQKEIGDIFGVTHANISSIKTGNTWADV